VAVQWEDLSPKAKAQVRATVASRKKPRSKVRDELERALFTELKMLNLPLPVRQYHFNKHNAGPRGKDDWRFDFAWPSKMFAVEVDGGTWTGGAHVRGKRYERDCEKGNEAVLQGWQIAHVTTDMVRDGRAVAYIERFFQTMGAAG
jgi:very-short-patch-repair endonuclease